MPTIESSRTFDGISVDIIWDILRRFDLYPQFMEHVVSVDITVNEPAYKESSWVVLFNGNELRWCERDHIDDKQRMIRFEQIEGDLSVWEGSFRVEAHPTRATYSVTFDLGVPALAGLLNPLGERAVRTNCEQILEATMQRVKQAA